MKKKLTRKILTNKDGKDFTTPLESSPGQQSAEYVVGLVSGSLCQQNAAASGSLSALFCTTAPATTVLFQPPPKKSLKTEEQQKKPEAKDEQQQQQQGKKKNVHKEKSKADHKVEIRESSLQEADDDEQGQEKKSVMKRKRKLSESNREKDVEYWVLKRQKTKAIKNEETIKNKRTVFVGNLPISCTKKVLRCLFKDKGSIESIRFRSVVREDPSMSRKVAAIKRKVHPQKQSLNAYVVFKDEDGVSKALERNGMEIEKDFFIRVDRVKDSSSHDHKHSVFVGNLPFDLNELAFRRHFEECGSVKAVRLIRDQNSGLGKGFGYVLFESSDSVLLALKLDGSKLNGRPIRVKRSVKEEKQNKTSSKARQPIKNSHKASGREKGPGRRTFQPSRSSTLFKGEMADPTKKTKKKGLKKKRKPKKSVHI